MSNFNQLLDRNVNYTRGFSHGSLQIMPKLPTVVLTCVDARVDPAHFLGIEPGEVVVIRNLGGRVDDSVIESVAILDSLAKRFAGEEAAIEVAVIHHNDCGVSRFSNPQLQQALAQRIKREASEIQEMAIGDPHESASMDADRLNASPLLNPTVKATGYVYDVTTGSLEKAGSLATSNA